MFIFYVVVLYGSQNFDRIEKLFLRLNVPDNSRLIFVQNKLDGGFPLVKGSFCVTGTNKLREFSGFDESIVFAENNFRVKSDDIFILMNDTIFKSFNLIERVFVGGLSNLDLLKKDKNSTIVPVVVEVGDIKIFNEKMDRIIATFFIAISHGLIKKIGGISAEINYYDYLSGHYGDRLFINPEAKAFNDFYNHWLGFGIASGVGDWPGSSAVPCNSENFAFLREKAKMCLMETHLAVRLKQHRVNIIDMYQRPALIQFLRINLKRFKKIIKM